MALQNVESSNILLAAIAALPGILAWTTRRHAVTSRVEALANEATLKQFNLLYDEARKQVTECRDLISSLRKDLDAARVREDELEAKVAELQAACRHLTDENTFFKESFRRRRGGGSPP